MKTIGQIAYEAFSRHQNPQLEFGESTLQKMWEANREEYRQCWEITAKALEQHLRDNALPKTMNRSKPSD